MLVGALAGIVAASYIGPPALGWYTSPGGLPQGAQIQAVVQIPEVIRYATSRLIQGQAIGGGIGAGNRALTGILAGREINPVAPPPARPGAPARRRPPRSSLSP